MSYKVLLRLVPSVQCSTYNSLQTSIIADKPPYDVLAIVSFALSSTPLLLLKFYL